LNMSLRSACFMMKSFLVNGKTSGLGNTLLKCRINRLSRFLMYQTSDYRYFDLVSSLILYCTISK
jgi:hypothetical protein